MGLANNSSNIKYVRIKDGRFYLNTDLETPYTELEGTLTGVRFKNDVFEGKPIRKCNFGLYDASDGSTYIVGLSVDSSYFSSLVGFLKSADLSKSVTFHPKVSKYKKEDGTDAEKRGILVSQDGVFLKGYFSKESGRKLPDFVKVKIGKDKYTYDKSDFLEELERIVTEEFIPNLPQQALVTETKVNKPALIAESAESEEFDAVTADGKLPWDK